MIKVRNKILQLQLFTLFLITVVSFSAFYFHDSMPDHFLSISSENSSSSLITYMFFSTISWTGFYFGPWVVVPFIIFALFYTLQFARREYFLDIFSFIPLACTGGLWSLYFFPELVGEGLSFFVKNNMSTVHILLGAFLSSILFLALSYRSSFKSVVISSLVTLGKSSGLFRRVLEKMNPFLFVRKIKDKFRRGTGRVSVALSSVLKGDNRVKRSNHEEKEAEVTSFIHPAKSQKAEDPSLQEEDVHYTPLDTMVKNSALDENASEEDQKKAAAVDRYKKKNKVKAEKEYYSIVQSISKSQRKGAHSHPDQNYFDKIITALEATLGEFKIEGKIVNVLKGPVVDTFELELGPGVKVSKVTNSENELSMALLGAPIRIVYPMIGRATVGIEVPRNPREIIYLDEVLSTKEYQNSKMKLPVAMGKNAFGETFVVDLASMPHMLVAGATGAGKSVFINTLLVSLLAKKSPTQMKLILIDPKQLELALYATLPHLVMPVITAPKEASISLLWACQEMERRYSILKEFGVRNIEGFNEKLKGASPELLAKIHHHYDGEPDEHYELPYLVIIVDEFADLILTKAGKEIENNICRLAAKARAAGIHLVLATQRPSVDVITGLIKSNFPTRVSFRVTSSVDSRTILNSTGAEKLLGKGDMLYRHGTDNLRVHSSYVDENEIEAMTQKLADMPREYHSGAMNFLENGGEQELDPYSFGSHIPQADSSSSSDEYYKDAVQIVIEQRTASASMLQRRMKIGYNRAANLIEEMESKGIVGPAEGSKRRKVLVSSDELT